MTNLLKRDIVSGLQDGIAANQSLEAIHAEVINKDINPQPKSGRQEFLENLINRYLD